MKHLDTLEPAVLLPIRSLPTEQFVPSEELHACGWPDFSQSCLAEWGSSLRPDPVLDDCALVLAMTRTAYLGALDDGWMPVAHRTGGIWDEQVLALVWRLSLSDDGLAIIHDIARAMANSNRSFAYVQCDDLVAYRTLLNGHGLDCNLAIQDLAEGFYPIDLQEEALEILGVRAADLPPPPGFVHPPLCLAIMAPSCTEL